MRIKSIVSTALFSFTILANYSVIASGSHSGGHGNSNTQQQSQNCDKKGAHDDSGTSKGHSHASTNGTECNESKDRSERKEDGHGDHQH